MRSGTVDLFSGLSLVIVVGAAGIGGGFFSTQTNGGPSSIGAPLSVSTVGGGKGGSPATNGGDPGNNGTVGGSGGGGGNCDFGASSGAAGTSGEGNAGAGGLSPGGNFAGGGGGANAAASGRFGGAGLSNSIDGSAVTYSVGGPSGGTIGAGSTPGCGGGGGDGPGSTPGGAGFTGVVIIAYQGAPRATGGSISTVIRPGWTVHTFTSNGTFTVL